MNKSHIFKIRNISLPSLADLSSLSGSTFFVLFIRLDCAHNLTGNLVNLAVNVFYERVLELPKTRKTSVN